MINKSRLNILSFWRKLKLYRNIDPADVAHLKPTIHLRKKWYGNSYGGFYIHPGPLHSGSVVYSFGIGKDISFDRKVMKKHRCPVFAFDPTPKSIAYIKDLSPGPEFHFFEFGISDVSGTEKFYLPKNKKGVSGSMLFSGVMDQDDFLEVDMRSIADITRDLGHDHIDVLKMDIEGSEYQVLESILRSGIPVVQLLVEFHDRFFEGDVRSRKTVMMLREHGFEIFGASLSYEEISFIHPGHLRQLEKDTAPL